MLDDGTSDNKDVVPNGASMYSDLVDWLEQASSTPRQIALLRIRMLVPVQGETLHHPNDVTWEEESQHEIPPLLQKKCGCGLASVLVPLLTQAVNDYVVEHHEMEKQSHNVKQESLEKEKGRYNNGTQYEWLKRILQYIFHLVQLDSTLCEELGHQGAHPPLIRLFHLAPLDDDDIVVDHHERVIQLQPVQHFFDIVNDRLVELQDIAAAIATASRPYFPILTTTSTTDSNNTDTTQTEELRRRLPLIFTVPTIPIPPVGPSDTMPATSEESGNNEIGTSTVLSSTTKLLTVLIHQVTERQTAQRDVGFVMWPSAVLLACWLAANPSVMIVQEFQHHQSMNENHPKKNEPVILELGAGCGLVGLTVARLFQQRQESMTRSQSVTPHILLTDYNKTVLENLQRNVALNDVINRCAVMGLDFYRVVPESDDDNNTNASHSLRLDMEGQCHEAVDIVLGADIICQPSDAVAIASCLHAVLRMDGIAYIVCADGAHRFGVDHFADQCRQVGLEVMTQDTNDIIDDIQSKCKHMLGKTTGYVDGMSLTLFTIQKLSKL